MADNAPADVVESGRLKADPGKYLTFVLGNEAYGLAILKVQEIIGLMNVTSVPRTPDFVRGVINLRGKVIPVVDLRVKFNMESQEDTERTCIIVLQIATTGHDVTMGIIVDEVSEVLDISADQIEPAPSLGGNVDTDFILGMGKLGDRVVMLLDVDKVLNSGEVASVSLVAKES
ncbi:MAG: purine-binding chemotaxis protein CheW [Candidatus Hydrogenedentes bacterium]|nr:purine-binding chemotaxis protein CheW [Candidatus Hydrogenedentota bacterium]